MNFRDIFVHFSNTNSVTSLYDSDQITFQFEKPTGQVTAFMAEASPNSILHNQEQNGIKNNTN